MTPDEMLEAYRIGRVTRWRGVLDILDDAAAKQIADALKMAQQDIQERLFADAEGLASISSWTRDRLKTVDAWIVDLLEASGTAQTLQDTVTEAGQTAATGSIAEANDIMTVGGKASAAVQAEMAPAQFASWFRDTGLNAELSGLVTGALEDGVRASVLTSIQAAGVQGMGTAEAVRSVLRHALAEGFEITKRDAITMVRTYTQTANVNAMMTTYAANADIVKGWKWCATLENGYGSTGRGTCLRCAALDGQVFPLNGGPRIPLHPRCRCVPLPELVTWRELGLDWDELEQAARPYTLRSDTNIDAGGGRDTLDVGQYSGGDYAAWLKDQSATIQRQTLGPGRYALFQRGLPLADMVSKSTGKLIPLKKLDRLN